MCRCVDVQMGAGINVIKKGCHTEALEVRRDGQILHIV